MNVKSKYLLVLTTERVDRTVRAKLEICYLDAEGNLRNPTWTGYGSAAELAIDAFDSLVIRAQCEPAADDDLGWYGWRMEFHKPYSVDLKRAESMCNVLRSLTRKLAKLEPGRGSATSFAEYAARVAEVLGGYPHVQFARRVDPARDLNGTGYQFGNVESLRYWLEDATKEKRAA